MDLVLGEEWFELAQKAYVLPELLIGKAVLENYCVEHKFACVGIQIERYYQAYQYLL